MRSHGRYGCPTPKLLIPADGLTTELRGPNALLLAVSFGNSLVVKLHTFT
jgi:hypothetical protein